MRQLRLQSLILMRNDLSSVADSRICILSVTDLRVTYSDVRVTERPV